MNQFIGFKHLFFIHCIAINLIKSTEIFVNHPTQGTTLVIGTDVDSAIKDIHDQIRHSFNLNPSDYQLKFADKSFNAVDGYRLLSDAGIGAEATVYIQVDDMNKIQIEFTFTRQWAELGTINDFHFADFDELHGVNRYWKRHTAPRQRVKCYFRVNENRNFIKEATECLVRSGLIAETDGFYFVPDDSDLESSIEYHFIVDEVVRVDGDVFAKLTDSVPFSSTQSVSFNDAIQQFSIIGPIYKVTNQCTLGNFKNWLNESTLSRVGLIGHWSQLVRYNIYFTLPPNVTISFISTFGLQNYEVYNEDYLPIVVPAGNDTTLDYTMLIFIMFFFILLVVMIFICTKK